MAKREGPTRGRRDRRLTDGEVLTIRASSETYKVLAGRYGCSEPEICYIKKFKHYRTPLNAANWDLSGDPTDQNRFMECNLMIDKVEQPCPSCGRIDRHGYVVPYPPLAPERPLYSDQPGYVSDIAREALNDARTMVAQALRGSNELKLKLERLAAALDGATARHWGKEIKGITAIYEAAKQLDSNLGVISWNGFEFNLAGDEKSIEELKRLLHRDKRCRWFERHHAECVDPSNQSQIPGPPGG